MTASISDLLTKREALDRQIREAQAASKRDAIAKIRQLMVEHRLTLADLESPTASKKSGRSGKSVPPKYRDPASGATWSGRGLTPKWLKAAFSLGKSIDDFAIQPN